MKNGSRLLVLVEDTTATRDLWPLWRRRALEPVLEKIESAGLGAYELNFVAFGSVDGQSNGILKSGSWTQDVARFRQYCDNLTFEGSGNGCGLAEALTEATYLGKQSSTLGELTGVAQHVLLFFTGSIGRHPVFSANRGEDIPLAPLNLLTHLVAASEWTVSLVTGEGAHGVLPMVFGKWTGGRMLKKCETLSKGRGCLMLIHPKWRHGYLALFPECIDYMERTELCTRPPIVQENSGISSRNSTAAAFAESTCEQKRENNEASASATNFPLENTRLAKPHSAFPVCSANYERNTMLSNNSSFPDAVDLSSWQRSRDVVKRPWDECSFLHDPDTSSLADEFAQEKEVLVLEGRHEYERDIYSDKGSKGDSNTSYGGGAASPAHSSSIKHSKSNTMETAEYENPYSNAPVQVAVTEAGDSFFQVPRTAISSQRTKTVSSSASVSIENQEAGGKKPDPMSKRALYSNAVIMDGQHSRQITNQASHGLGRSDDSRPYSGAQRWNTPYTMRPHPTIDEGIPTEYQVPDYDVRESKRSRTTYDLNRSAPLTTPSAFLQPPNDQEEMSPFVSLPGQLPRGTESRMKSTPGNDLFPRNIYREMTSDGMDSVVAGALMPAGGFRWNVEWSGPLYLAGPIMRQTEPQKLFDIEISCTRMSSSQRKWPRELVVCRLDPKEQQRWQASCVINLKWESITEMGRVFAKWLQEKNLIAMADIVGEKSSRLVISAQDSNTYGQCQLVAGFQRECNRF